MGKKLIYLLWMTIIWSPLYFLINNFVQGMQYYNYESIMDSFFPLIPFFIVFYISAYVLIVLPIAFIDDLRPFTLALLAVGGITAIIFILFPGNITRPEIVSNDIFSRLLLWMYSVDNAHNVFPSSHVSLSFLSALIIHKRWCYLWLLLILISTLLVEQHFFWDVVGGLIVGAIGYIIYHAADKKTFKEQSPLNGE